MGWHASDTHELSFNDCRVPADHLLGERGRGFQTFLAHPRRRPRRDRRARRRARAGVPRRVARVRARAAGVRRADRPLPVRSRSSAPTWRVAVENARNLTYKAAWLRDHGRPHRQAAAMAKLYSSEVAVTRDARGGADPRRLRVHGGVAGEPPLPRREDPRDRRGHERDPASRARAPGLGSARSSRYASARGRDAPPSSVAHVRHPVRHRPRRSSSLATAGGIGYAYWFANDQIVHHTKTVVIKKGVLAAVAVDAAGQLPHRRLRQPRVRATTRSPRSTSATRSTRPGSAPTRS